MAVTRFEIVSRAPYEYPGYERIDGTLHFAVDPGHPENGRIADLSLAPRSSKGQVEFSAGFVLLKPEKPNRRLLSYVVNRGGVGLRMNRPPAVEGPNPHLHPGDGFLLKRGWTVAMCGWQWDVIPQPGLIGLEAPMALHDGKPIPGRIVVQFQPNEVHTDQLLAHQSSHPSPAKTLIPHKPYPVADVNDPTATLTERATQNEPRRLISRERWRFTDDTHVALEGGFQPGVIYEIVYSTRISPVVGVGLLAMRDSTSWLRYASDSPTASTLDFTYLFGISQCGRFMRQYLHDAMNVDEQGRPAYDGLLVDVAGARRGEFNHRYAQPSVQHVYGPGLTPPFTTGELMDRQRARGGTPKVFEVNSSSEYWRIDCSLIHTDTEGIRDAEPPSDARIYMLAGTRHGSGSVPLNDVDQKGARGANAFNVVDYMVLVRNLLVRLDQWISAGVEPPPSAFPRLADGTAIRREEMLAKLASIRDLALLDPAVMPRLLRVDPTTVPARTSGPAYPCYVSDVDADGNEIAGIRLPDLTVPVGRHFGWVARHPSIGGAGQNLDMYGATVPFTPDEIRSRYPDRSTYLARVRGAAQSLVSAGYLLEEDIELVEKNCADRYDAFIAAPARSGYGELVGARSRV